MNASRRIDVFLRESVPFEARSRQLVTLSRLQSLRDAGLVDAIRVDTWANRTTETCGDADAAVAVLDGFQAWADARGVSLTPAFESHDSHCGFTDRDFRTTVFPVVCLAVYEGDELVGVYPHSTDTGTVTVADALSVLEADVESGVVESDIRDPAETVTDRDRPTP